MSPFIRKVKTASGATAVQIAEKIRGQRRILEHIGSGHTDAELAALMATARDRLHPGQGELDLFPQRPARVGVIESRQSRWLWEALVAAWDGLGFDAIQDEAFQQLVLARLIEPASKTETVRILRDLGLPAPHLSTVKRALKRCQERDYRDLISRARYAHAQARGTIALCLYDVTTLLCRRRHNNVYADVLVMPMLASFCCCDAVSLVAGSA